MSAVSILMRRTFLFALPVRGYGDSHRREGDMARKAKKQAMNQWDAFSASMTVEGAGGFETNDAETYYSAMQYLIDTGLSWKLQGWFGRAAMDAINNGYCHV